VPLRHAPPPGQARIWFYRVWNRSESLNVANIDVNGVYVGSVEPGGAFYCDVARGVYHIVPQNQYGDYNQNTNVSVVPGEQVFVAVLDLTSWPKAVSGGQWYVRGACCARITIGGWPTENSARTSNRSHENAGCLQRDRWFESGSLRQ
jgi:hypothetical protein